METLQIQQEKVKTKNFNERIDKKPWMQEKQVSTYVASKQNIYKNLTVTKQ